MTLFISHVLCYDGVAYFVEKRDGKKIAMLSFSKDIEQRKKIFILRTKALKIIPKKTTLAMKTDQIKKLTIRTSNNKTTYVEETTTKNLIIKSNI